MFEKSLVTFIQDVYKTKSFIPLHAPTFLGNEHRYVKETIDSTFVSSVGKFVDQFEQSIEKFTGAEKSVSTVNGTAALYTALYVAGVRRSDLVITQALTFVATCNVIHHLGAEPIFLDVSSKTLGLSPHAVSNYLDEFAEFDAYGCFHKITKQRIKAVVPMHTFGHPVELDELKQICEKWGLRLIEDAAESLGSFYKGRHTGTLGEFGVLSFNGNKIITTGGGGMILCANRELGERVKHITTTAKVPHPFEFFHDEPGFNHRLPNINAALGYAQMEALPTFLAQKRQLAETYKRYFSNSEYKFIEEPEHSQSNYWLNAIICPNKQARDSLLKLTNEAGVMTRPVWQLMHRLPMYQNALRDKLEVSEWLECRVVNLPSSPTGNDLI